MAEARAIPSLGGYDEEFVNAVEEDLHCVICQLPLNRFCRQCLDEHFRRLELNRQPLICPVDRNNLIRDKDIFPDKATERPIISFIIRCPSEGCQWTGELRSKDLHQSKCRRFPLNCLQNCGAVIPREEISTHIEKDCPLTIISCPYAELCYETKIRRGEAESHLQSTMNIHLDLACVKLSDTQVELSDTQVQLNDTQVQLNDTQVQLNATQVQLSNTLEELHDAQEKLKETKTKLEEKVDILEKTMQCSEDYNWKISGFSEVLKQAKSGERTIIRSAPFYRYGYKCRLRLDPNGYGPGENTHLSIFFAIMKGEYDAILSWSFHKKVKFTLIDQQEDTNDRKNIAWSFTTQPGNERCCARPVTDVNTGRGFPDFVSHNKLQERRYIVDDTIFLQVKFVPA